MRSQRASDVDLQPSENGHVRVRLRSPEEARPAGPSVRGRLVRPLPLIGVLLVVLALVGYWSVYSATTHRTPVLVAAHDPWPAAFFATSDLRVAELAGDAATMASFVPERELETVLGRELAAPVPQGTPLARASVTATGRASGLRRSSCPRCARSRRASPG